MIGEKQQRAKRAQYRRNISNALKILKEKCSHLFADQKIIAPISEIIIELKQNKSIPNKENPERFAANVKKWANNPIINEDLWVCNYGDEFIDQKDLTAWHEAKNKRLSKYFHN